jgi:hypothetical protein
MKKPGIPTVITSDRALTALLIAVKENVEIITGARPQIGKIQKLTPAATTDEIVAKLNEIISRLNFDGE